MQKAEEVQFKADLKALCTKYRLNVFMGFYVSQDGPDEQDGIIAAGERPANPNAYNALAAASNPLLRALEEVKPFFQFAHLNKL